MIQKEAIRQDKRRMPTDHPPRKLSHQATSIVYPHREYPALPWKVDFPISVVEVRTKDKPTASFLLRINSFHIKQTLGWLTAARELRCTITTKNPEHVGLWDKSSAQTGDTCCCKDFFVCMTWTFLIRAPNIRQNIESYSFH